MAFSEITDRQSLEQAVQFQFRSTAPVEYTVAAIHQVEAQVNSKVRIRHQIGRSTASVTSRFTSLPSDFLGMVGVQINSDPVNHLEFLRPDLMDQWKPEYTVANDPKFFSIIGDEMELMPVPDEALQAEMTYYKKLDSLDADGATNWLVTNYPQVYFFGVCKHVAGMMQDNRLIYFAQEFEAALELMIEEDDRSRYPTGTLNMRSKRVIG
jgi:hypothetical protein